VAAVPAGRATLAIPGERHPPDAAVDPSGRTLDAAGRLDAGRRLDVRPAPSSRSVEDALHHPWSRRGATIVPLALALVAAGLAAAALGPSRSVALAAGLFLVAPGFEGAVHGVFHVAGLSHQDTMAVGPSAVPLPATDRPPLAVSVAPPAVARDAPFLSPPSHECVATAPRGGRAPPDLSA
jgi:hypothetical protein